MTARLLKLVLPLFNLAVWAFLLCGYRADPGALVVWAGVNVLWFVLGCAYLLGKDKDK